MLLNRKLILAVLTLGLVLSFCSAAIGYNDTKFKDDATPITPNPNAPLAGQERVSVRHVSDILKPVNDELPTLPTGHLARPIERVCEEISYDQGDFYTAYTTPSSYTNTHFGNSYSVANACTLKAIGIAQYGPWILGDPDAVMSLYTGNGSGYPTTLVKSWTFPYASLSLTDGQWLWVDLTADAGYPNDYILAAGDEFFITGSTIQNTPDDKIRYLVGDIVGALYDDEVDVGITFVPGPALWYTMSEDGWGGWPPRAFTQFVDICYEEGTLSECYNQTYSCDPYWLYGLGPGAQYQQDAYAARYSVNGPESLTYIDIAFYDVLDDAGVSYFDDPSGNFPTAEVTICPPAIAGGPDDASPLYTFLVAPEDMTWYTRIDVLAELGLGYLPEFTSDFYVVIKVQGGGTGLQEIDLLSDGDDACPSYRSWGLYFTGFGLPWTLLADLYGADNNLLIDVTMCKNVYTTCGTDFAYCGYAYNYGFPRLINPPANTLLRKAIALSFEPAFSGCDVDYIDMFLNGGPQAYAAEVGFYLGDGPDGLPGTRLMYIPIAGGETPSGFFTLAPNFYFESKIWVAFQSLAGPTHQSDRVIVTDDGSCPSGRTAFLVEDITTGISTWFTMFDLYGFERNPVIEMYRCCYPFTVRTCAPDGDWPTMGKDFARTQSTLNELGEIQCNLTKSWTYKDAGGGGLYNQPVIADGKVFFYMFDNLVCLDINDGSVIWNRLADFVEIGSSCRATPTYKDGYLYCGGGATGAFLKLDAATGVTQWAYGANGSTQYAPNVIMDVEGTEVIYFADLAGYVYGLRTSDGFDIYSGACFASGGQIHKALTSDGTHLYVGCDEYENAPNVFRLSVSLTAVTEDWNLVDDGPGWQLQAMVIANAWNPEISPESCISQILYSDEGADGQWIYFVGEYQPQNQSPVHPGGILYKLSADGTTLAWTSETTGNYRIGVPSGIINDKASVIFGSHSNWNEGGEFYGPMCYSKSNGRPQWGPNDYSPLWNIQTIPDEWGHVMQPGVLTCETILDAQQNDWLIFGNEFGYWNFADATAGEVIWSRRAIAGTGTWTVGPTMDEAGHLILANGWTNAAGSVHCLAISTPRPRLHIADMSPEIIVEFGLPEYVEVTFEDLLVNNGCADLTIFDVVLLEEDNGTFPTRVNTVNSNRAEAVSAIAREKAGYERLAHLVGDKLTADGSAPKIVRKNAAFALPEYILSVVTPADNTVLPPGGSSDITLAIDGTKVPRGVSSVYAEIHCDDPDYFLDSAYMDYGDDAADPTVLLSIVGGCVYQWTRIEFGDGGENGLPVYNSSRICTPDGTVDGSIEIDGNTTYLFGCDGFFYSNGLYSVDIWNGELTNPARIVMHATEGGSDERWEGILPDPLGTCAFGLANDVILAEMSDDGAAYSNVLGTIMNYAFVDSVEDHTVITIDNTVVPPETTWTWEWDKEYNSGLNVPYSAALTEGFAFKAIVSEYAVTDVTGPKYGFEDFWNFAIIRQSLYSRYGYAIPNLSIGLVADWDISVNTSNSSGYSQDYSISWMYEPAGPAANHYGGGSIKIPFGPGFTPMINSVEATTAWYGGEEPGFDSIYVWMTRPSWQFRNNDLGATTDRRLWSTVAKLNLPAWPYTGDEDDPVPEEAYQTFGIAFFGKFTTPTTPDLVSAYSGMATIANKLCGFGRGDVNDDGVTNLVDIVYLNCFVFHDGNGPFPFKHLGEVDGLDNGVGASDVQYMINWYFNGGPAPVQDWSLPQFAL